MKRLSIDRQGIGVIASIVYAVSGGVALAHNGCETIDNADYYYNYYVDICIKGSGLEAVTACDKALDLRPKDVVVWTNRGVQLANLGEYEAAIDSYNRALDFDSDYSLAWVNRCADQIALGRYIEALSSCRNALDGDGRWGELGEDYVWYNLGVAQEGLERYDNAGLSYQRALELNPENAAAWNGLGYALERSGRYEEALNAYERAVNLAPNVDTYRSNLEIVLQRLR
ncbi:MAG: tetratricopeptide repeat protein [Cyanobacteria bacterium SID2]|nr:tetratricopeptide repeat protein [Cyanobacteria bacterium SID2]MBP0004742.1 tetratricopeptide repeat protein [Cyanobacteria bacterium SBC]